MNFQGEVPALRRNRRIPSCEPCRIGKLRCDHERPICRRCIHRRKESSCVYHPAPMSKKTMTQLTATSSSTSSTAPSPNIAPSQSGISVAGSPEGVLGSTSFFASLAETQQDLDFGNLTNTFPFEDTSSLPLHYDETTIGRGVKVLRCFYPFSCMDDLFSNWRCPKASRVPTPILKECCESIKTLLAGYDATTQSDSTLRDVCKFLTYNTSRKLPLPGNVSMKEYAAQFTGPNTRWETVGAVLSAISLEKSYKIYGRDGLDIMRESPSWKDFIDATGQCLAFCDNAGAINDVVLWILGEDLISLMLRYGEASYIPWKRLGDLSSSLFALGLYKENKVTPEIPGWLVELRKHNLLYAYILDKFLAVFVGRPPRIIGRYCALQLPMLLEEDVLALAPAQFEQEIARRGDSVWQQKSLTQFSTFVSMAMPVYMLREEILELFLGTVQSNLAEKVSNLAARSKHLWDTRDDRLKYHPSIWESLEDHDEAWNIMELHLDQLYNDWLLQRIMVQRLQADPEDIFRLSENLLSDGLTAVMHVAVGGWNLCDLPWMILMFCLPPAGVLTLELLRQSQSRKYRNRGFSRSKVIQNLSVLVNTLGCIGRPGIGDWSICKQAQAMLQRSLDRILGAAMYELPQDSREGAFEDPMATTPGMEDWALYDLVEPDLEFWSSLEEHSLLMFNVTGADTF